MPDDQRARDLLRIARAVVAADRLVSRANSRTDTQRMLGWHRNLLVRVEVEDAYRWRNVQHELERSLFDLTADVWNFSFDEYPWQGAFQLELFREELPTGSLLALYSGGLDSTIGWHVLQSEFAVPVVRVCMLSRAGPRQASWTASESMVHWFGYRFRIEGGPDHKEPSYRSRGFLFVAMAAALAVATGCRRIVSCEPGYGALNLPLSDAQIGAMSTRSMRPSMLRSWEVLLGRALETELCFDLPFMFLTKGELAARAEGLLPMMAQASFSCDRGNTSMGGGTIHCGKCSSCICRRIALGGRVPGERYRASLPEVVASDEAWLLVRQARELQDSGGCCDHPRWGALLRRESEALTRDDLSVVEVRQRLEAMLLRHADEVTRWYEASGGRIGGGS